MSVPTTEAVARRKPTKELARILSECRDMAVTRLSASFGQILDRLATAIGGGVLFDRSVFSAINVVSGDSISFAYTVSFSSGS